MKQGATELTILGLAFLSLQAWWVTMTIKTPRKEVLLNNEDLLSEKKKRLERLIKKEERHKGK